MKIILNNIHETLEGERLTVNELLKVKKFSFKMLIIKINGKLVKRESYDKEVIVDGDNVNVLHLISGG
jgi:sulfur carrier protein